MPARDKVLFCAQMDQCGLWELDPQSGAVQGVGPPGEAFLSTGTEDDVWLHGIGALLHVAPKRRMIDYSVGGPSLRWVTTSPDAWPLEYAAPGRADDGRWLGHWIYGTMDMGTAAVHGDCLWCRCGATRLAILRDGQKLEDAAKIENDILDGEPVLQFFETPYGLLAVGKGSAGIVELEPGQ